MVIRQRPGRHPAPLSAQQLVYEVIDYQNERNVDTDVWMSVPLFFSTVSLNLPATISDCCGEKKRLGQGNGQQIFLEEQPMPKYSLSIYLVMASLSILLLLAGASLAHAGESCGGEGERGCCLFEQIPSCDNADLIEDLTPSCVNQLGDAACLCRGEQSLLVNPLGTKSSGVCRKKKEVGESCDPVFDPCLPNLQCRAVGFENALIKYACFADVQESISTGECNALYSRLTHDAAIAEHTTLNFGVGFSASAGADNSDERGVVYGRDGCYGCYKTFCAGVSLGAGVSIYAAVGASDVDVQCDPNDASCISFDGVGCTESLDVSTGIELLGLSTGFVQAGACGDQFDELKQVGAFDAVELGVGVSPIVNPGLAECTTQVKVTSCLDNNGNVETAENSPPVLTAIPFLNQECNGFPITTFQAPSGFVIDPDGDALIYVWQPAPGLIFDPPFGPEPDGIFTSLAKDFASQYFVPISTVQGRVYVDTNNNGNLDPGEHGLAEAQVSLLDSSNTVKSVLTPNPNGDYSAVVPAGDTLDVLPTMLPTGEPVRFTQTSGMGCGTAPYTSLVTVSDTEAAATTVPVIVTFNDTQAPVITTGAADQTVECDGGGNQDAVNNWLNSNGGAFASESCSTETWSNDFSAFSSGAGAKTVAFTATDECGLSASTSATFTIEDTTPPSITCPAAASIECTGNRSATFTPTAASATDICAGVTVSTPSTSSFPLGTTTLHYSATDDVGLTTSCTSSVTVEDTTPPNITSVTATPDMLWPPNHKMAAVTVQVDASDICDGGTSECKITAISSNEPINSSDDGDTAPDWEITGPLTVNIRAERSGTGTGRLYMLDVTCTDQQSHGTVSSTTVTVPYEQ